MKTTNNQLSATQHDLLESAACNAIEKCSRALAYGVDMRSSRLLLLRDAQMILNTIIQNIDSK